MLKLYDSEGDKTVRHHVCRSKLGWMQHRGIRIGLLHGGCYGGRYDYPVCSHGRNRVWLRQEQANRNRTLQIYHRCDKNAASAYIRERRRKYGIQQ